MITRKVVWKKSRDRYGCKEWIPYMRYYLFGFIPLYSNQLTCSEASYFEGKRRA